ncbi:hypothetical protein CFP56_043115 [Quercus suber]|uniref:Uncharacterized protein n=1 Tax=Quercus suber TaxID=58331 RepID=A0AAW0LJE2_QUESU
MMESANTIKLEELSEEDCWLVHVPISQPRILPQGIGKLINLRLLIGYNLVIPRGIGRLTSLRTLNGVLISDEDSKGCKLEELKILHHLQGYPSTQALRPNNQQTQRLDLVRFFQEVSSHATTHWKANAAIPRLLDRTTVSPNTILFLILRHHDPQLPSTMPPQSLHKPAIPSQRASGAVILVISIMQDKTETFISISTCCKSLLVISSFIEGKSASRIDLDGSCSTYANKFSTLSTRVRRSSMEEGALRSVFPAFLISFSNSLSKAVIFSSNLESQNTNMENFYKAEEHLMCTGWLLGLMG